MSGIRSSRWGVGAVGALMVAGLCLVQPAWADDGIGPYSPADKLGRGLSNLVLGFLEIPRNIHATTQRDGALAGGTVGLGRGIGYTLLRMVTGAYEIVTFPIPVPEHYEPIVQPEYPWEDRLL